MKIERDAVHFLLIWVAVVLTIYFIITVFPSGGPVRDLSGGPTIAFVVGWVVYGLWSLYCRYWDRQKEKHGQNDHTDV